MIFGAKFFFLLADDTGFGPRGLPEDIDAARFCKKLLRGFGASSFSGFGSLDPSELIWVESSPVEDLFTPGEPLYRDLFCVEKKRGDRQLNRRREHKGVLSVRV